MSNLSGLSAILTVSLVAIVTLQMIKDKFDIVENYGEEHNSLTYEQAPVSARNVSDVYKNKQHLDEKDHSLQPLRTGDLFTAPFISPDANTYNAFPEAYSILQQKINAATPNMQNFNAIGCSDETATLLGPNHFMNNTFAPANVDQGRAGLLGQCAQNMPTTGTVPLNVASSLLPSPSTEDKMEGFESCGTATNLLANQVFLTNQIGMDLSSGSLRNQSKDIRSLPPNPRLNVGPWLNSTRGPDLLRRPLEGCGPSFGLYGADGPYSSVNPTKINL